MNFNTAFIELLSLTLSFIEYEIIRLKLNIEFNEWSGGKQEKIQIHSGTVE
tara:strand:+ start:133 stop:285 length:153 start_codon:yes stop_codon:yes gene_type:complete